MMSKFVWPATLRQMGPLEHNYDAVSLANLNNRQDSIALFYIFGRIGEGLFSSQAISIPSWLNWAMLYLVQKLLIDCLCLRGRFYL